MYYGARYYKPPWFIQPDANIPDAYNPQDLNRYSYVRNNPYKYVDDSGNIPIPVITGLIGAGIGAGISIGTQYYSTGQVQWADVWKATIIGGVAGATAGFGGASILGTLGAGVGSGRVAQVTENALNKDSITQDLFNPKDIALDFAISGLAHGAGKVFGSATKESSAVTSLVNDATITPYQPYKTSAGEFIPSKHAVESISKGRVSIENFRNTLETAKPFDYSYQSQNYKGYYDVKTKTFVATQGNRVINTFPTDQKYIQRLKSGARRGG